MDDEVFYHQAKRSDQVYISRAFPESGPDANGRMLKFASKVIDSEDLRVCDVQGEERVIRVTNGGRQEIKVLFFEDDRSIKNLIFQRFTSDSGRPIKRHFSFHGEEIDEIVNLLNFVVSGPIEGADKSRFSGHYLQRLIDDDAELWSFVNANRERLSMLERAGDLAHYFEFLNRKRQLEVFERLLRDSGFFEDKMSEWERSRREAVWQFFFEQNPWIFGLGLSPVFLSSMDEGRLEQVVRGYSIANEGKRVDALMRTNGVLSSLCFVEVKTHATSLLKSSAYRSGAWPVSDELSGAVTQCQVTVQGALKEFQTKLELLDDNGDPVGREAFLYQPRSYLVIGSLEEFLAPGGPNELKFRSFELFRRNIHSPEIVTFDELFERAKATVNASPSAVLAKTLLNTEDD